MHDARWVAKRNARSYMQHRSSHAESGAYFIDGCYRRSRWPVDCWIDLHMLCPGETPGVDRPTDCAYRQVMRATRRDWVTWWRLDDTCP
jgi:hypothetical protein